MRERELLKLVRKDAHYRGILKMDVVSLCEYVSKKYQAELTLAQGNILLSHLKESDKTRTYLVKWEIEIEADSPEDAAHKALSIQRDENSTAVVFDVQVQGEKKSSPYRIDFMDGSVTKLK